MRRLPLIAVLIILFVIITISSFNSSESPHGNDLKLNCSECHTTEGWKMDPNHSFQHSSTNFQLKGQHATVDCKSCHPTLIFNEAGEECSTCHADVHERTVGTDCERCHNPNTWLVTNIIEIHQTSRFPLVGAHIGADCIDCHKSESLLQYPPMSVDCIGCHTKEYQEALNPNHIAAGFSTDCENCHNIAAPEWNSGGFHHNFFPLTEAHNIQDCNACHNPNDYAAVPKTCYGCHSDDYNSTTNPNHLSSGFTTDCTVCHTLNPGWKPANFNHDPWFPIYSGKHNGEWSNCTDCHSNSSDYKQFTCVDCHEHRQSEMDDEHDDVKNYIYQSNACLNCHPKGEADD